jgi:hypothetical protein
MLLHQVSNSPSISWQEQVLFDKMTMMSTLYLTNTFSWIFAPNSLKQQSIGRHVTSSLKQQSIGRHVTSSLKQQSISRHVTSSLKQQSIGRHVTSSLKQQSIGRHVTSLVHINLITRQPVFALLNTVYFVEKQHIPML